jgi:hypothetical protein
MYKRASKTSPLTPVLKASHVLQAFLGFLSVSHFASVSSPLLRVHLVLSGILMHIFHATAFSPFSLSLFSLLGLFPSIFKLTSRLPNPLLPYMGAQHKYEISKSRVGVSWLVIQTQPLQPSNINQFWLKTDFGCVSEQSLMSSKKLGSIQECVQNQFEPKMISVAMLLWLSLNN